MKNSKIIGLLTLLVVYLFAVAVGLLSYHLLLNWLANRLIVIFLADIIATLFVWGAGVILKTASIYDPYWSVQPLIILLLWIGANQAWGDFGALALLLMVGVWSVRLTANFIYTFTDLSYQDWRYTMLKEKSGPFYQLVSLLGIHLFPTIVVYACVYPMLAYIEKGGSASFNPLIILGIVMMVVAVLFELIADIQMQSFRSQPQNKGQIIRVGLWKHNRHPNYFGEILMWWGVYVTVISLNPNLWFVFFGALINTLMFMVISIPMAERRLASYKAGFRDYVDETWMVVPLPFAKRKRKAD